MANYVQRDLGKSPCTACGGQIKKVLDDRKYACIQCGRSFNWDKANSHFGKNCPYAPITCQERAGCKGCEVKNR